MLIWYIVPIASGFVVAYVLNAIFVGPHGCPCGTWTSTVAPTAMRPSPSPFPRGANSTTPTNEYFTAVTFRLWTSDWLGPGTGTLRGAAGGLLRPGFTFSLPPPSSPDGWATWISPNASDAARWGGGGVVRLLVVESQRPTERPVHAEG